MRKVEENLHVEPILVILVALLLFSTCDRVLGTSLTAMEQGIPYGLGNQVDSTPIHIDSDDDFESQGWNGSGTLSDPYRIERLRISSDEVCITITNTTAHCQIQGCTLSSETSPDNQCIVIWNAAHIGILNSTMNGKNIGIDIAGAFDIRISSNRLGTSLLRILESTDCIVENNTVGSVTLEYSTECSLIGNIIGHGGLQFYGRNAAEWNHDVTDNTVNDRPLWYFTGASNIAIRAEDLGQLFIVACNNVSIGAGIIDNVLVGATIAYSEACTLADFLVVSDTSIGIRVLHSSGISLVRCDIYGADVAGIQVSSSSEVRLSDSNSVSNDGVGLHVADSHSCTVADSNIIENRESGILVEYSDFIVLERNLIERNDKSGTRILTSNNALVSGNHMIENQEGLLIEGATSGMITNNVFLNNVHGVYASDSSSLEISGNTFNGNVYGLVLDQDTENCTVYANTFLDNRASNAIDDGYDNIWDDGFQDGNAWDDYQGDGVYTVPGSAGSIDRYPRRVQTIDLLLLSVCTTIVASSIILILVIRRRKRTH